MSKSSSGRIDIREPGISRRQRCKVGIGRRMYGNWERKLKTKNKEKEESIKEEKIMNEKQHTLHHQKENEIEEKKCLFGGVESSRKTKRNTKYFHLCIVFLKSFSFWVSVFF